jgi:short-subunit dehydrogenase
MELKNKVAIVTGSSKGLGISVVKQLLDAGVTVIGWSRSATPIVHPNFKGNQLDIGDETKVKLAFKRVIDEYQKIDFIINNAGFGFYGPLENTDSSTIQKMFDTNVLGIFYLTKCALPYMKKAEQGHIINVASIAGLMGIENMSVYNATKFAVKGMSESLFKELRPHGIKVSCILPGSIGTEFFNDLEGLTLSKTMMNAEDVADAILYCLKSPASFHPVNFEVRPFPQKEG